MDEYEDYDDIGYPEWIENEMEDAWMGGVAESWSPALLAEVTAATTPQLTALFRRDRETLWIHAYKTPRMIVETHLPVALPAHDDDTPGLIDEVHIGARASIADEFYSRTSRAASNGFERVVCIDPVSGDPWSTPSVLDDGRETPF